MPTYTFTGSVNISAPDKKEARRQLNTHYAGLMVQEAKCEENVSINDAEHPFMPKCPHEDNITYLGLLQVDGNPQYEVKCEDCGKKGIIYLEEFSEDWESLNK